MRILLAYLSWYPSRDKLEGGGVDFCVGVALSIYRTYVDKKYF